MIIYFFKKGIIYSNLNFDLFLKTIFRFYTILMIETNEETIVLFCNIQNKNYKKQFKLDTIIEIRMLRRVNKIFKTFFKNYLLIVK